tara:strand:- start:852 stop:1628 length:777 start_codon:yes stop_codon:yes gene_type:complete
VSQLFLYGDLRLKKTVSNLVIFAVLFTSGIKTHAVFASEKTQSRFGNVTLNIPNPRNLCRVKNNEGERERDTLERMRKIQRRGKNKLLAFWVDCDSHKQLQRNNNLFAFNEWMIIVGYLSGKPPQEKTFPQVTQKLYLKSILKEFNDTDLDNLYGSAIKGVNKDLEKIDPNYLGGKTTKVTEPINLGLLAVTDSIHTGMIINVKGPWGDRPVAAINGSTLIKGVIVHYFFYNEYKNKSTIKTLLSKSKFYSEKLTNAN